MTHLKRAKKTVTVVHPEEAVTVEYLNEPDNRLKQFYQAIQILNRVEKALIFLFLEGLSHKEISTLLGIAEGHARVKLNRVKINYRK